MPESADSEVRGVNACATELDDQNFHSLSVKDYVLNHIHFKM